MGRIVDVLINARGVLIPGPNYAVNMFLPDDHRFVLFMKGERPFVMDLDESGEWTFSGEVLDEGAQWPVVALVLPCESIDEVLGSASDEDITAFINKANELHRRALN